MQQQQQHGLLGCNHLRLRITNSLRCIEHRRAHFYGQQQQQTQHVINSNPIRGDRMLSNGMQRLPILAIVLAASAVATCLDDDSNGDAEQQISDVYTLQFSCPLEPMLSTASKQNSPLPVRCLCLRVRVFVLRGHDMATRTTSHNVRCTRKRYRRLLQCDFNLNFQFDGN